MLQSSVSVQGLVSKEPIWKVGGGGRGKERRGEEGGERRGGGRREGERHTSILVPVTH